MATYYNEIDPYAAQWLRNLIDAKLIAPGHVDTRSIIDVRPADLAGFEQCHFFAGLGGWSGALRLAGVSDTEPLWTGSCPCQPFSLAGKQKGFDDARHLWPVWRELIAERRPAKVYGEQVASAAQWLGLVRSDLEALGYAVGCLPIEAASSGADHLRDRFWFVGNDTRERRGEGRPEHAVHEWVGAAPASNGSVEHAESERGCGWPSDPTGQAGRRGIEDAGSICLADPDNEGSQRRPLLSERSDQRTIRAHGLADSHGGAIRNEPGRGSGSCGPGPRQHSDDSEISWVIGADGKARRVKSGVRLLAHGIPQRVAKLRALGNAIDLRPAATFIRATM